MRTRKTVLRMVVLLICAAMFSLTFTGVYATDIGPYEIIDGGCVESIEIEEERKISGEVDYFRAIVNSHIQGLEEREAIPYRTFGAIGSKNTKMFVYSVGSKDNLDYSRGTVKEIVERFEQENPGWNALAAINGDFFDIETKKTESMGEPEFPMVQAGDVYKTNFLLSTGISIGRGIVGTNDAGEMIYCTVGSKYRELGYGTLMRYSSKYSLQIYGEHRTNTIAEYPAYPDSKPVKSRITFITPDSYPRDLSGTTVFVLKCDTYRRSHVGMNGEELGTTGYYFKGEITEVRQGTKNDIPPKGYVYVSTLIPDSYDLLNVGTYLKCQQNLTDEWADVTNAIGFKQQILANSQCLLKNAYGTYNTSGDPLTRDWTEDIYDYPYCWKDRTAIGFRADNTPVLLVVKKSLHEGTYKNLGASYYEIAEQLKSLGCVNGFLLDGGGSSTFVVRNEDGTFSNAHIGEGSDGRPVANAVILAVRDENASEPEYDEEVEVVLPTDPATERKTEKKNDRKTDLNVTESENSTSYTDTAKTSGCRSAFVAPLSMVTLGCCAIFTAIKKKRRN